MFNIRIQCIHMYLRSMPGEERRCAISKFLCLVFSTLLNVSGTNIIDFALEKQREVHVHCSL